MGITDLPGIEGQEHSGDQADARVIEPTPQPIHNRHGRYGWQNRQTSKKERSVSKTRPGTQEQVIQHHVAFALPDQAREVVPTEARQRNAECFIKPECLPPQKQETQDSSDQHQ